MKRFMQNLIGTGLLFGASIALAHPGHSLVGTVSHELEHGFWLVALIALGALLVGEGWLRSR